jgi:spermidine synthase
MVTRLILSLLIAGVFGAVFLPLLGRLGWLDKGLLGVVGIMVFLIARLWGALLPYLAEMAIAADEKTGMRTALLYLANILGSAAGSILTGFVLMDYLGLTQIAAALVVSGAACTILVIAAAAPRGWRLRSAALAGALALAAVVFVPPLSAHVLADLLWKGLPIAKKFTDVSETRSGIITVAADGTVFGNGMYDGQFNTDLKHDTNGIVRAYALTLFHPAPRDVLMIGLSSGSWAQVVANDPEVASLTVVEINPGYVGLIARQPEVASLLSNPKVRIVTDDGRRWLRANPARKFDAIMSNTTFNFRASATNLLSREFLGIVRAHLNPGGIFFYNTTGSGRVQRTGCMAFHFGARFTNHVVVSDAPIAWDFQRWRRVLESYRIDGQAMFDTTRAEDRAVLDRLMAWQDSLAESGDRPGKPIEPCPQVIARTAGDRLITDDNMGTEWLHFIGLE